MRFWERKLGFIKKAGHRDRRIDRWRKRWEWSGREMMGNEDMSGGDRRLNGMLRIRQRMRVGYGMDRAKSDGNRENLVSFCNIHQFVGRLSSHPLVSDTWRVKISYAHLNGS